MSFEGLTAIVQGAQLQRDLADLINFHANVLHDATGSRRLLDVAKTALAVFVAGVGFLADGAALQELVQEAETTAQTIDACAVDVQASIDESEELAIARIGDIARSIVSSARSAKDYLRLDESRHEDREHDYGQLRAFVRDALQDVDVDIRDAGIAKIVDPLIPLLSEIGIRNSDRDWLVATIHDVQGEPDASESGD